MANGVMDRLITRLELEDKFSKEAREAAKAAKEAAKEMKDLQNAADHVDDALGDAAKGMAGFKDRVMKGFLEGAASNPYLAELAQKAMQSAEVIGQRLVPAIAQAVQFIIGPGGLAIAIGVIVIALDAAMVAFTGFIGAAQATITAVTALWTAGAPVLGALLSLPFIKAAAEFDDYKRQFAAFLGSTEAGEKAAKFLQNYGLKSAIDQGPLFELARSMVTQGVNVDRFLPVFETLSLTGGPNKNENAMVMAQAIRYIMGGRTGEAVESLGRQGIGRQQMIAYGASFDANGQFQGTAQEFLDILEKITKSPQFQDAKKRTESSIGVQLSNAGDAFNKAIVSAGETFAIHFLPVITKATDWLNNLSNNGAFTRLAEAWGNAFDTGGGGLQTLMANALAILEDIPDIISAGVNFIKGFIDGLLGAIRALGIALKGSPFPMLKGLGGQIITAVAAGQAAIAHSGDIVNAGLDFLTEGRHSQRYINNLGDSKWSKPGEKSFGNQPPVDPEAQRQTELLAQIQENTKKMVDIKRFVLGGGEVGRMGVTAADVSGWKGSRSRGSKLEQAMGLIGEHMLDLLEAERRARGNAYG